jgi:hypothetical protein
MKMHQNVEIHVENQNQNRLLFATSTTVPHFKSDSTAATLYPAGGSYISGPRCLDVTSYLISTNDDET